MDQPSIDRAPDRRMEEAAAAAAAAAAALAVGDRVCDGEGCRGTVRYVGPVASAKNAEVVWVGVEWDDFERGKNDGAVVDDAGVETRYFQARGPTAASFVKPAKLDRGIPFVEALRAKFVGMDAPLEAPGGHLTQGLANTKRGATKKIELVGEIKVRSRQQLDEGHVDRVTLRVAKIATVGRPVPEVHHLDRLVDVDLQCNLLGRWATVADLARVLPALLKLDVSGNRLDEPPQKLAFGQTLTHLAANDVGLSAWPHVAALVAAAPALTHLHVAAQSLRGAVDLGAGGARLEMLDVAKTGLTAEDAAAILRQCPHLAELHASENATLDRLIPEDGGDDDDDDDETARRTYSNVMALGLSAVGFADWKPIDTLTLTFPALDRLRFTDNPALTTSLGGSQARAFVIARIPTLTLLNGADVSAKERVEAEKRYVRFALADAHHHHHHHHHNKKNNFNEAAAVADPEKNAAASSSSSSPGAASSFDDVLFARHPHAPRLAQKHATTAAGGHSVYDALGASKALSASLLTLRLRCVASANADAPVATKKVPAATKLGLLRRMAAKLFDLPVADTMLFYRLDPMDAPTYLDDDDETLASFGVADGTQVDVAEKIITDEA